MTFVQVNNRYSSSLAILAGILLIIARPPITRTENAWTDLFNTLNNSGQTLFGALAWIMSVLVQLGGITICVGGFLCLKKHLRSGKELVGIGTGVGIADLLLLAHSGTFGPIEWLGWGGLVLAILAGRHLHGPDASYAGEIRKMLVSLRTRLHRQRKQAHKRAQRLRARRAKKLTGQHNFGRNKEGEGE